MEIKYKMQDNINKNIQKAVALKYDMDKDNAPKNNCKGKGRNSFKYIVKIVKQNNIPIKKMKIWLNFYPKMDIDKEIPTSM